MSDCKFATVMNLNTQDIWNADRTPTKGSWPTTWEPLHCVYSLLLSETGPQIAQADLKFPMSQRRTLNFWSPVDRLVSVFLKIEGTRWADYLISWKKKIWKKRGKSLEPGSQGTTSQQKVKDELWGRWRAQRVKVLATKSDNKSSSSRTQKLSPPPPPTLWGMSLPSL